MARDPVCGMEIDKEKAEGEVEYEGQTYFFCASGCRKKFAQDPKRYVPGPQRDPNVGREK
jgi:YHS domain-containing protein